MNLNKVFVLGNLAKDPEMRTIPSGQQVATFSIATNRVWYNQAKEKNQEVEFHNIVAWGKLAEIVGKYLKKGAMALVEGRIKTRSWQAQDGTKKYRTEIIAESLQMGPKAQGTSSSFSKPEQKEEAPSVDESMPQDNSGEITTDEVPF
jgi:single-strand DNA-binding protein